jgi:GNAT superfamily N-acetyltransferase
MLDPSSLSFSLHEGESPVLTQLTEAIWEGLSAFNEQKTGLPCVQEPLVISIRDSEDVFLGGLNALTYWGWLYVKHVWIHDSLRGQGVGTKLFDKAEAVAMERGCYGVWLDTFSFQAKGFYEKRGYQVLGTLAPFPENHSRYVLWKSFLADSNGSLP